MPADPAGAYSLLINPSGGLVAGDRLEIEARLGPDTHVVISSLSATKVYRSTGADAVQAIELSVAAGGLLEWVPELTILFARARFSQQLVVTLGPGARLLLWDAFAAGRVASGERWQFTLFENELEILTAAGGRVLERMRLEPGADRLGRLEEWDYFGSFYLLADGVSETEWKELDQELVESFERRPGRILAGVAEPAAGGRIVKVLARATPDLQAVFEETWTLARQRLCRLPVPNLRRY